MREWILSLLLICTIAQPALAASSEPVQTVPQQNSSFISVIQTFLRQEFASLFIKQSLAKYVNSGGLHGTSGSCTASAISLDAVTSSGNRITADGAGGTVAIDYSAANIGANCSNPGSDVCYAVASTAGQSFTTTNARTVVSMSTLPGSAFNRVGSSNIFLDCSSSSQPSLPADSVWLFRTTITNGAITAVTDLRQPASFVRRGVYDITDPLYGATDNSLTDDDTTAIQTALTAVTNRGGGIVHIPKGTYRTTSALTLGAHTTVQGEGRRISVIVPDHTGDALTLTGAVNGNVAKYVILRSFGLDKYIGTHGTTGGGFVDMGAAFVELDNVFIRDFANGVILDQAEHIEIHGCEFIVVGASATSIWLVNADERTATANANFTNVITIRDNQFNAVTGTHILDDGGVNHNIEHNNFNVGTRGIKVSNASDLRVIGNFFEGQTTEPMTLTYLTAAGNFYAPTYNPVIEGNAFSTVGAGPTYHISIVHALNGAIRNNEFVGSAGLTTMMRLQSAAITGLVIEGNTKTLHAGAADKPFVNATNLNLQNIKYRQRLFTKHTAGVAAGAGVVLTPLDMGLSGTLERPKLGEYVVLVDPTIAISEQAAITAITATTLTVTLANSYSANFYIFGGAQTDVYEDLPGSTAKSGTGAILNGATSVTITHGLVYVPTVSAADIQIVPTLATTNPVGHIWVSNVTATAFQVNCTADPGISGMQFAWRVLLPYRNN